MSGWTAAQPMAELAPPRSPSAPPQYYYAEDGEPVGPITFDELKAKIAAGLIKADTPVWKAGTPSWVAARRLPEIAMPCACLPPPRRPNA
jgi:hypothetical protein